MTQKRIFPVLLPLIVLLSLALRFYHLERQSFWLDEMFSINVAMNPSWSALFWDNHPLLYHFLLRIWVLMTNPFEFSARSLSALFSLGTTIYLGFWGRKAVGPRFGLLISFLHAINPISILYAQEARMYALLELVAAWQMGAYWHYQEKGKAKLSLTLSSILLSLTHYTAIFIYLSESLLFFLRKKKGPDLFFLGTLFLGCSLIMGSYLISFSWFHLEWQKMKYALEPESRWPWGIVISFGFNSWVVFSGIVCGLAALALQSRKSQVESLGFVEDFGLLCFLTFILIFAISYITERALFLPRYFIFLAPFWLAVCASIPETLLRNSGSSKGRIGVWLTTIMLIGIALPSVSRCYEVIKAPWRQMLSSVIASPDPIVYTTRSLAIRYPYLEINGLTAKKLENSDAGFEKFINEFPKYKTLWIIENYFGGLTYLSNWKDRLVAAGFRVEDFTLQDLGSEPLLGLKVTIPEEVPQEHPKHKKDGSAGTPKKTK